MKMHFRESLAVSSNQFLLNVLLEDTKKKSQQLSHDAKLLSKWHGDVYLKANSYPSHNIQEKAPSLAESENVDFTVKLTNVSVLKVLSHL